MDPVDLPAVLQGGLGVPGHGRGRLVSKDRGSSWRASRSSVPSVAAGAATPVIKRDLEQWWFRITNCSDELLDYSGIDYPEPIRLVQTNWIGRSEEHAEIGFPVEADDVEPIRVFTTRPDTVFGATFMVLAPEHPLVDILTTDGVPKSRRTSRARDAGPRSSG